MAAAAKNSVQPAAEPKRYERRIEFCYEAAVMRRHLKDPELADWRLVAAFPEPAGLHYILIFEREVVNVP